MKCKFCGKEIRGSTGHREFCNTNCYQKWRYHNIPEVKDKIIEKGTINRKKRYANDEKFREQCIKYSRNWQKKNKERVVEIVQDYQARKKETEVMNKQAKSKD